MNREQEGHNISKASLTGSWSVLLILAIVLTWVYFSIQEPSKPLAPITHILVEKNQHKMTVYHGETLIKEYRIALGFQPIGPKQMQDDGKTPEGRYKIIAKNDRSRFHRSLKISYPNEKDTKQAVSKGVPPGNEIMIHGLMNGFGWLGSLHTVINWTRGCIAVTNPEITEIFAATSVGTPIEIRP